MLFPLRCVDKAGLFKHIGRIVALAAASLLAFLSVLALRWLLEIVRTAHGDMTCVAHPPPAHAAPLATAPLLAAICLRRTARLCGAFPSFPGPGPGIPDLWGPGASLPHELCDLARRGEAGLHGGAAAADPRYFPGGLGG